MVAGGTIVLIHTAFVGAGCRGLGSRWCDNRAFFCCDLIEASSPLSALGGPRRCMRNHHRRPGRRNRDGAAPRPSDARRLACVNAPCLRPFNSEATWFPNAGSKGVDLAFSLLPLTALIATELLAVWLAITASLGAIVIGVRARRLRLVAVAGAAKAQS